MPSCFFFTPKCCVQWADHAPAATYIRVANGCGTLDSAWQCTASASSGVSNVMAKRGMGCFCCLKACFGAPRAPSILGVSFHRDRGFLRVHSMSTRSILHGDQPLCIGFWSFLKGSCSTLWQHYGRRRVPLSVLRVICPLKNSVSVISVNEVITYLKVVHSLFSLTHRSWCGWFTLLGGGWAWLSAHLVWSSEALLLSSGNYLDWVTAALSPHLSRAFTIRQNCLMWA